MNKMNIQADNIIGIQLDVKAIHGQQKRIIDLESLVQEYKYENQEQKSLISEIQKENITNLRVKHQAQTACVPATSEPHHSPSLTPFLPPPTPPHFNP